MNSFQKVNYYVKIKSILFLFYFFFLIKITSQSRRIVNTGVPFLTITPDARAAGIGDSGIASSPDTFSQHWNASKYVFSKDKTGIGVSYTPYLNNLINDIFLANITYFNNKNNKNAWGTSIKYFSLGNIILNEFVAGNIIETGVERPNEIALDFSYSLQLSNSFSTGITVRYIRSDLKFTNLAESNTSANTIAFDLSAFYQSKNTLLFDKSFRYRYGIVINNLGPRIKYNDNTTKSFLPTKLGLAAAADIATNKNGFLTAILEINKLLVPTAVPVYDNDQNFLGNRQPDISFLSGIFTSFGDAPDGLSEELKEIYWSLGFEYTYKENFFLRTGYFNENEEKGARRFITLGAGANYNNIQIDLSYLLSVATVRNPFQNALRFSLSFFFE